MSDIICIGDTVIDLFMQIEKDAVITHGEDICFIHGSKVPVNKLVTYIGGNAYNSCIGLNKLGIKADLITTIGADEYQSLLLQDFKKNNIDTSLVQIDTIKPNNVHAIIGFNNERTIFSHHEKRDYVFPTISSGQKPKVIYYTSLGYGYEKLQNELISYIEQNKDIILVYSPGSIQLKDINKVKEILKHTTIIILNKDEAHKITTNMEADLITLHKTLHELGPKLSVITDGVHGSSGYDEDKLFNADVYGNNSVVDKTGAGDAYTSAFIAGIFYKKPLKESLTWGMINSGHKVQSMGATAGLCTVDEIEQIKKFL